MDVSQPSICPLARGVSTIEDSLCEATSELTESADPWLTVAHLPRPWPRPGGGSGASDPWLTWLTCSTWAPRSREPFLSYPFVLQGCSPHPPLPPWVLPHGSVARAVSAPRLTRRVVGVCPSSAPPVPRPAPQRGAGAPPLAEATPPLPTHRRGSSPRWST